MRRASLVDASGPLVAFGSMAPPYDTISFISDYGHADEFVGVVHSVIRQLSPSAHVIDITHDVAPFDVRAGGLILGRSAQYLAPGVVMAVIDPGAGSARRPIAVEVDGGQSVLIGPDNGVLAAAVAVAGGATRAFWLNNSDYHLGTAGSLDAGRDVFAPVAAHLCNGVPLEEIGEEVSTASLLPGTLPISEETDDGLRCEVIWIDRYGNAQLNVDPDELDSMGKVFEVRLDKSSRTARRAATFSDLGTGAVGLVLDSYGAMALVCNSASAAEELQLEVSDSMTLVPLADERSGDHARSQEMGTPVRLSRSALEDS